MKASAGIRDKVTEVMGYNNPEMTNYYHARSQPFMRFRAKEFGQRVESIKEAFRHMSVREQDWELGI
ncbi:hypothetical protein D9M68_647310 [compost metagenome]